MTTNFLCVVDANTESFQNEKDAVDVVCVGDSITGWNNFGSAQLWPYPTYPGFLQELCDDLPLKIANGGIAGEISQNGIGHVHDCLSHFPNATYFVVGFGTNDLGRFPTLESTSSGIIDNLNEMVTAIVALKKKPILFNVPYVNESRFSPQVSAGTHSKRDYHNLKLKDYCSRHGIPLVDICSHLRNEHFADELHPNAAGARAIAQEVFQVLRTVHGARCF